MKSFAVTFALFLLIAPLSFSQSGYPRLTIIDGDSIVAITIDQAKKINGSRVDLYECRDLLHNMTDQALILDSLYDAQKAVGTSQALEILILEDMNRNRSGIIENIQLDLKRSHRKLKAQKLLKWGGVVTGIAAGFVGARAINL